MRKLQVKICGMKEIGNVREVCELSPDYIGFIFYPGSKRFVGADPDPELFEMVPPGVNKTAVFVDEAPEKIIDIAARFQIKQVQLHGKETTGICRQLKASGLTVIKAIPGDQVTNGTMLDNYASVCDYFLFDTPVSTHGGSGRKFDWSFLEGKSFQLPYFLSGGIDVDDADAILAFNSKDLYAVDVNSRFELRAGVKDRRLLKEFLNRIRNEE